MADKVEQPSGIAIDNVTTNSVTFIAYTSDDVSYNKYLKLVKNGEVIAVGEKHTGEVDLTGVGQRHFIKNHEYALSYDVDDKMELSKDALTPIYVGSFNTLGTPEAPKLTVKPIESGFSFTFNKPNDWGRPITGYTLSYAKSNSNDWQTISLSSNSSGGTLNRLTEDSEYKIKIWANNEVGSGDASTVYTGYPNPTAPTELKAEATEDGATISATKVSDIYRLDIYKASDLNHVVASGATQAIITGLESDLSIISGVYKAYWYNTKSNHWSSASEVPGFTTLLHKPGFPILTLTPYDTQIQYKLTLPSDDGARGNGKQDILYYTLMYHKVGGSWQSLVTNSPTSPLVGSGSIGGLDPDTDYEFRATATNKRLTSEFCPTVTTTTLMSKPDAPTINVVYEEPTTTTIPIHITPGESDGSPNNGSNDINYYISTKINNSDWGTWQNYGQSTSPIISGLTYSTQYQIRVQARNKDASSDVSNTITVYTRAPQIKADKVDGWLVEDGSLIADTDFLNDVNSHTWLRGKRVTSGGPDGNHFWEFTASEQWDLLHGNSGHSRFKANIKPGDIVRWRYKYKAMGNASKTRSFEFLPEAYDTENGGRTEYGSTETPNATNQGGWTTITGYYKFNKAHDYLALVALNTNYAPKLHAAFAEVELYLNQDLPASYQANPAGYNHSKEAGVFKAPAQDRIVLNINTEVITTQTGTGQVSFVPDPSIKGKNSYLLKGIKTGEVDLKIADKNYPENSTVVHYYINNNISQSLSGDNIKVTGVSLDKNTASIEVDESVQFLDTIAPANASNKDVTWSSSDPNIASVDDNGRVTGVSVGEAIITVKTNDQAKTASANVTVTAKTIHPEGVTLDKSSLALAVGDTTTLKATITPSNTSNKSITWTSSNPDVATVDGNGTVTGKKAGNTTITVKTVDGSKSDTASVIVSGNYDDNSDIPLLDIYIRGKDVTFNFSFPKQAKNILQYNLSVAGELTGDTYRKTVEASKIDNKASGTVTLEGLAPDTYDVFFSAMVLDGTQIINGQDNIFLISK